MIEVTIRSAWELQRIKGFLRGCDNKKVTGDERTETSIHKNTK